jgi:hypothetical protein
LERAERDKEKRQVCKDNGITLIEIPYWWDKTLPSLAATIRARIGNMVPDIIDGKEIPLTPSGGFIAGMLNLLINNADATPELMHGMEWDGNRSLEGWYR